MEKLGGKRKTVWEREPASDDINPSDMYYLRNLASKRPKYRAKACNLHLDLHTKIALLKASPSVVVMRKSFRVQGPLLRLESNHNGSIVLTSANLIRCPTHEELVKNILVDNLKVIVHTCHGNSYKGEVCAHDFHFNLAAIRFKSESPLATATLAHVDDSVSVTPLATATLAHVDDSVSVTSIQPSFQLHAHSRSFNLVPGDKVIALARYFAKPFDIMAAAGDYCLERTDSEYGCRELLTANCRVTRCGDGGPLVNINGEVIGMMYYDIGSMPWMPIKIVCKWWEHYKRFGEYCRPALGIEATNLYVADECIIERIMLKFPSICEGVFIEKVVPGSSADLAGICANDVIIQCGGETVQGFLEFFEIIMDHVGDSVEVVLVRADCDIPMHLRLMVVEVAPDQINSWPNRS